MRWAVILAGGAGTRFWPESRAARPKQFLRLGGERTLLEETMLRATRLVPPERVLLLTLARYADAAKALLAGLPAENVVGEPASRNTAPSIGLAAAILARKDPKAEIAVLPADHRIAPPERFAEVLEVAFRAAAVEPALVTLGIVPKYPATEYGYIERGELAGEERGIPYYAVASFQEKPDRETAKRLVASGNFFWNAGIFAFRAEVVLDALKRHLPELAGIVAALGEAAGTPSFQARLKDLFPKVAAISVDYGVLEKARNIKTVRADFEWDDLGSWLALERLEKKDGWGNVAIGEAVAVDSQGCVICSEAGHLVAAVGLKDAVVVHTKDATLVCPKENVGEIRKLIERLKRDGKETYL